MATYQMFVKLLNGQTQCLQIPSPTISGETLKSQISLLTKIPPSLLLLLAGSRLISDQTLLSASHRLFPSCHLLLRLRGGKGGFGSLLRGAATKAGHKKTNNFDACRDMNGRRLRHVNAERKIEEWKAEEGERRLERLAERFLKKKEKERRGKAAVDVERYLEKYREDSGKCVEEVEEAVRESFGVYRGLKRRACGGSDSKGKRLRIWDMNGRRLRHVNAERKIEEWKAEEGERRLERLAERFLKKKEKERRGKAAVDVERYLEKYREDSGKCVEEVEEAVRESFGVYRGLKRRACGGSDSKGKRLRIWYVLGFF